MEKEKLFLSINDTTVVPTWNSSNFGMEIESNELNCGSRQLSNCFFNPNWDNNSLDQSDPFESALSSMVSSPAASNVAGSVGGDGVVLTELIGRLGSICNSSEISPQTYIGGNNNNSTNTSCYSTPLNSPPKLNLSMMDHQIRANHLPNLAPFSADPGFAERAARFSSFGARNFGLINESELSHRLAPPARIESGKLSRVSSNQSIKIAGSPMGIQENKDGWLLQNANLGNSDKKFRRFSRSSTPENAELGDSREESSVSEQTPGGEIGMRSNANNARKRKSNSIPKAKAKEIQSSSNAKDAKVAVESDESNSKRSKQDEKDAAAAAKAKAEAEAETETNEKGKDEDSTKPPEPPKDYIHVRARRGQATDSHSLAERVRREKISERMKFLQDLVPGCNKVTGKAVMLDEIINYVQSLQRQVEFLSMKLATVNPRMDFSMDALVSKDILQSRGSMPQNIYPLETASLAFPYRYHSPQSGMPNGMETSFSLNPLNAALRRNPNLQLPPLDGFGEAASQASTFWEDDLQSVVQMGFSQNQPQNFHGTAQMKVEL